jgi:ABC-type transport system involved in cytochrome c biogenesis ATPase subunit
MGAWLWYVDADGHAIDRHGVDQVRAHVTQELPQDGILIALVGRRYDVEQVTRGTPRSSGAWPA